MRQWLEAGYFKGDLPISQSNTGPFLPLSKIFPDLTVAFKPASERIEQPESAPVPAPTPSLDPSPSIPLDVISTTVPSAREETVNVQHTIEPVMPEEPPAPQPVPEQKTRKEKVKVQVQAEESPASVEEPVPDSSAGLVVSETGNSQSAQLKMMLGLSSGAVAAGGSGGGVPVEQDKPKQSKRSGSKAKQKQEAVKAPVPKKKSGNTTAPAPVPVPVPEPKTYEPEPEPEPVPAPVPAQMTAPAKSVWGVSKPSSMPRKTMSEIQREEARASGTHDRNGGGRSSGGGGGGGAGWAGIAASGGTSAWNGAARPTVNTLHPTPTMVAPQPSRAPAKSQPAPGQNPPSRGAPATSSTKQQEPAVSSNPTEVFGATMSPALEAWCREQMKAMNGNDDLTLIAFCMTLTDPAEIRQYLLAYLGSSPRVSSFASEFIQKRGLGAQKQERWESTKPKKGRKKNNK